LALLNLQRDEYPPKQNLQQKSDYPTTAIPQTRWQIIL